MAITISDIARLANVSKATVSLVLNNKPGISENTRQTVLETVKRLNYRPSELARSLSKRKTRSIGLVIKEIDNPYFSKIMKGVYDTCILHDYTVLLGSSELSQQREFQSIQTLVNQRVEGLIIAPLQGKDIDFTYLTDLIKENYALVTLDIIKNYPVCGVEIDNIKAARSAVSYLIEKGHRRIAYFTGPSYSTHSYDRYEGYRGALLEGNIQFNPEDVIQTGSYIDDGYQKGKGFFSSPLEHPTAVFCYNDLIAIGLIDALLEMGISVPDDVSVMGMDDIDICAYMKVPLTTVRAPVYEIGKISAESLIKQIENPDESYNENILLNFELVIRESVAERK